MANSKNRKASRSLMKEYVGTWRNPEEPIFAKRQYEVNVNDHPLNPRHDLQHLSDHFTWGFAGPGTDQLAIAILADLMSEQLARTLYLDLAIELLESLREPGWTLSGEFLEGIINNLLKRPPQFRRRTRKGLH